MSFSPAGNSDEVFRDDWSEASSEKDSVQESEALPESVVKISPVRKRIRQPSDPLAKFDLTVIGSLINLFQAHTQPLSMNFLKQHIASRLDSLRRTDGSKYSKSPEKVVLACLSNTDLFAKSTSGWVLRGHNAERFKERMLGTLACRVNRKVEPKEELSLRAFREVKTSDQMHKTVLLLERLEWYMKGSKEFQHHFKKPFGTLTGTEEITDVAQAMGNEKFLGVLIACELLKDYFSGMCYRASSFSGAGELVKDLSLLSGMANTILTQAHSKAAESSS